MSNTYERNGGSFTLHLPHATHQPEEEKLGSDGEPSRAGLSHRHWRFHTAKHSRRPPLPNLTETRRQIPPNESKCSSIRFFDGTNRMSNQKKEWVPTMTCITAHELTTRKEGRAYRRWIGDVEFGTQVSPSSIWFFDLLILLYCELLVLFDFSSCCFSLLLGSWWIGVVRCCELKELLYEFALL